MDKIFTIMPKRTTSCDYFAFTGNIDAQAEALLKGLPAQVSRQVVKLDFTNAGRINSMGIALLLRCFKRIKEERQAEIRLVQVNNTNTMLFKMTGVFLLATAAND